MLVGVEASRGRAVANCGEGALHQYLHKYLPTKSESSICIKHISIESYVNYYAINLDQVISQRKINDTRFTTG